MTSDRQRAANRANAKKSTGPRSLRGKQASQLNARAHGLASVIRGEPGADADINELADAIVEEARRPDLRALAVCIAEAEIDLRRVRRARARWEAAPPTARYRMKTVMSDKPAQLFRAAKRQWRGRLKDRDRFEFQDFTADLLRQMDAPPEFGEKPVGKPLKDRTGDVFNRYERRALSRRKFAIREFDAARAAGVGGYL